MDMDNIAQTDNGQGEEERYQTLLQQQNRPLSSSRELLFSALGDASWRVRKQAVEIYLAARAGEDELKLLIDLLRDEDNAGLRNSTAELLVRYGQMAVPILLEYLDDPDHDLRKLIVDALGAIGGEQANEGLIRGLSDPDMNVAAAAAEGIGLLGFNSSVPALLEHLKQNQDTFFRFNLLLALGSTALPGKLPDIIRQLATENMLRRAVYECLGKIGGDTEAVTLLLEGVMSHLPSLRRAAICSLTAIMQRLEQPLFDESIKLICSLSEQGLVGQLLSCYSRDDHELAVSILYLLGFAGDQQGIETIFNALADERLSDTAEESLRRLGPAAVLAAESRFKAAISMEERVGLCRFVGNIAAPAGTQLIRMGLADQEPEVRTAAVYAAARRQDPVFTSQIADMLNDSDHDLREASLAALRKFADIDCRLIHAVADRLAESAEPEQRRGSAVLFSALQNRERLASLLKDENPQVREAAAVAMGRLKSPESCQHLLMALVDEDTDVRIAATEALGLCCDLSAVPPLRVALKDPDVWVQAAAINSLVQLIGEDALLDLYRLWKDGDDVVQLACLDAFERIGSKDALREVSKNLGHRGGEVLKMAVQLLHRQDQSLLLPWFNHLICHEDWDIRLTAIKVSSALPLPERCRLLHLAESKEDNRLVLSAIRAVINQDRCDVSP